MHRPAFIMHRLLTWQASDEDRAAFVAMVLPQMAPPPPPARKWPSGRAMCTWINLVLDIEMRSVVSRRVDDIGSLLHVLSTMNGTTIPETPADLAGMPEFAETVAIVNAKHGDDSLLLGLLSDPKRELSMTTRKLIAARLRGREAHRPKKPERQRRADSVVWRAVEDASRIETLLRERYPRQRLGVVKEAAWIAAERWGLLLKTVENARDR